MQLRNLKVNLFSNSKIEFQEEESEQGGTSSSTMASRSRDSPTEEKVASLEREVEETRSRMWKFEEKTMDLTSKLEISRENIKVLKRGYAEKAGELEGRYMAKEEAIKRRMEEAEAQLRSVADKMEEKDNLIQELQRALAGQATEAHKIRTATQSISTSDAERITDLDGRLRSACKELEREAGRASELEQLLAEARLAEEMGRAEHAETARRWAASANERVKEARLASEERVAELEARLRQVREGAHLFAVGDLTLEGDRTVDGCYCEASELEVMVERVRASESGYQAIAAKLDDAVSELRKRDRTLEVAEASMSHAAFQALELADDVRGATAEAEQLRYETARWHEALKEHTICMMRSSKRHTREWHTLYDELLAAYASATRRLAGFEQGAGAGAHGKPGASPKGAEEEKEALSREVSMLKGRLQTAQQQLKEASSLEESLCSSFHSLVEVGASVTDAKQGSRDSEDPASHGEEVMRLKRQLTKAIEGVRSIQQSLDEGLGEVEEEMYGEFQQVRFAQSLQKTPHQSQASSLQPQSAATQFSRRHREELAATLASIITNSDASASDLSCNGCSDSGDMSGIASPSGWASGGDWQAVSMTPARRRNQIAPTVVLSSSKRVRAPPMGLAELLECEGSEEEEEDAHAKPFGEWAKGRVGRT